MQTLRSSELRFPLPWKPMLFLALAPAVSAQGQVWVVDDDGGPGVDFLQISAAVEQAAEGDTILISAGGYARFEISSKSLVLASPTQEAQLIRVSAGFEKPIVVRDLAPDQRVVFRGLGFTPQGFASGLLDVLDCQGSVLLDECRFLPGDSLGPCIFVDSTLTISNCEFQAGIDAEGCVVHAFDSVFQGQPGVFAPLCSLGVGGATGFASVGGLLYTSGSHFEGGEDLDPCVSSPTVGGSGLSADGTQVFALDSEFVAGGGFQPGVALDLTGGAEFEELAGESRGLGTTSPVSPGDPVSFSVAGIEGDLFVVLVSPSSNPVFLEPLNGTLLSLPPYSIAGSGVIPAGGRVTIELTTPSISSEAVTVFAQGAHSAVAGGIHLGAPAVVTVLG